MRRPCLCDRHVMGALRGTKELRDAWDGRCTFEELLLRLRSRVSEARG